MSNITLSTAAQSKAAHSKRDEARNSAPVLLPDDHLVLLAIDALLALHAAFQRWRKCRKTLRALAKLDAPQLRDIGLARGETATAPWWQSRKHCYRALADLDDDQLSNLSEAALRLRRDLRAQSAKIRT